MWKCNSYTSEQWAKIGKYAAENSATCAAKHYTAVWGVSIDESIAARRLKSEYLKKLEQDIRSKKTSMVKILLPPREPIVIKTLETKDRGRPLLLSKELDAAVQEFVNNLRAANGVVNRVVVMGATQKVLFPIVIFQNCLLTVEHIEIIKSWAKSLLSRI